jgi:hypothetical protein
VSQLSTRPPLLPEQPTSQRSAVAA